LKDFRDLNVWKKSDALVLAVYKASRGFPKDELFSLTSQLRRTVASVPANISEGCGRASDADFGRFLQIAMGSACETEYHLLLAYDLHYLNDDAFGELTKGVVEVKRMLASLLGKVKAGSGVKTAISSQLSAIS
jgi:four helix bundle protein